MATLAASTPIRKHPTVFYAHLDDQAGALCKIADVLYFVADDGGTITVIEPAHVNFLVVLGAMQLADAQRIDDLMAGGAAGRACTRPMVEV